MDDGTIVNGKYISYKGKFYELGEPVSLDEIIVTSLPNQLPSDFPRRLKQFMNRLPGVPIDKKYQLINLCKKHFKVKKKGDYEAFLAYIRSALKAADLPYDNARPSETAFRKICQQWNEFDIGG